MLSLVCSVVSGSLWSHRHQSARLLCPWDSPGKNTGVGCHFLLQGIFLTQGSNLHLLLGRYHNVIMRMLMSPTVKINTLKLIALHGWLGHESSVLKNRPRALSQRPQKDTHPFQCSRAHLWPWKQALTRHQVCQGLNHRLPSLQNCGKPKSVDRKQSWYSVTAAQID